MKKSTIFLLAAMVLAGSANAQLRWNPENSWSIGNGATMLPVSEDNKTVVNKLGKLDNGNWRNDMRFAQTATFTEDEPYLVVQITTQDCAWNLNDFKFEFMIQRKLSEGLDEKGAVKWGGNTQTTDPQYPSFRGDKLKVVDEYEAELFQLLGSSVVNGDNKMYSEDVIVIDLNKVQGTDADRTPGLLFSAGDVYFPNYNSFQNIVEPDENGLGGVQQRSWFGFICIAPKASVTSDSPSFTVHYTGTVADSSDALTVCEDYANGDGGKEVRDGDEEGDSAVSEIANDNFNVYLKNGKTVVANDADITVYTADGKKVAEGRDNVELPAGLYIINAVKNGVSKTVKAIAK